MPDPPQIAVWHRDDLRISDNHALTAAVNDGHAFPLFIFDPHFYRSDLVNDTRLRFLHEALEELDAAYREIGSRLALIHGSPMAVLPDLDVDRVYLNQSVTARYGKERDSLLREEPHFQTYTADGIVRGPDSRENWDSHIDQYFTGSPFPTPRRLPNQELSGSISCREIENHYDITPQKKFPFTGGVKSAWEQLKRFSDRIDQYPRQISDPAKAETGTSHLSAYLKFGCVSVREVFQYIDQKNSPGVGTDMFEDRLYWNRNFQQKLADWPGATKIAINPVMRGLWRDQHDPDLVQAWKEGETGYPLVDASMRALRDTGWMNFRMRAMTASFYSYILQCYWRDGADHFYRHLIDADPAINYGQWQIQAGLTGKHPLRIYDPIKQVREHDPQGEFIFQYIPELEEFPIEHLPAPWQLPTKKQKKMGIVIGEDYPAPVVEYKERKAQAESMFDGILERASEALQDPAVWRRASLSSRHEQPGSGDKWSVSESQQTIDDYSES